jgi:hypothetical protein
MARHAPVPYLRYSSAFRPLEGNERHQIVRKARASRPKWLKAMILGQLGQSCVMGASVQKSIEREWALTQHQFRMSARKVAKPEQAEEERPRRQQTDTERYLLQIDKQTKRSFKTPEDAQAMGLEIKARFPILQVSIYDSVSNSRTVVGEPR